ncbi:MAG: cytochrome P450 [Actinomycetales bacterium]|nr:cytochrome P450 [Actinomycetales bacterium]
MTTSPDAVVDITDPALYANGIPHEVFAELRRTEPIAERRYAGRPFWAVTRYQDLVTVTRDPDTYSSARGMTNLPDLTEEQMNARRSIIDTDRPDHIRLRRLGMPAFTSHKVKGYEEVTREIATRLLSTAAEQGSVDIVKSISAPLPIRVIVNILGVPEEDADMLVQWSDELIDSTGVPADAYGNTTPLELLPFSAPASHALFEYGRAMREERTRNPQDDLVTTLVEARYEGEALSDYDFKNMFHVLVFAGNETTRTAISNGIKAFIDNPDQLDLLYSRPELIENAVEEIIRYATPVLHMRRTATRDTELAGVPIRENDKVVIYYCSANFDETEFVDPLRFDITRPIRPPHVAFGAKGPHHCLGAPLARMEIRVLLEEMVKQGIRFEQAGPIARTNSNFVNGIAAFPALVSAG